MSVFDGVCLQTGNTEHWMKSPAQTSLVDNDSLFTYLTSQGPLKPVFSDHSQLIGPPIDGKRRVLQVKCLCLQIIAHLLIAVLQHSLQAQDVFVLQRDKETL